MKARQGFLDLALTLRYDERLYLDPCRLLTLRMPAIVWFAGWIVQYIDNRLLIFDDKICAEPK